MRTPKMILRVALLSFFIWIVTSGFLLLQESEDPIVSITTPLPGEAVQGLVSVFGTIEVEGFLSYQLEFSFATQDNSGWFLINQGSDRVSEDLLGEWDTSTIPDDTYNLRLTVQVLEQDPIFILVEGIRVRNYSAVETNTPEPTPVVSPTATTQPQVQPSPTVGQKPSSTPYPANPAEFSLMDIQSTILKGGVAGLILFFILLVFWLLRLNK